MQKFYAFLLSAIFLNTLLKQPVLAQQPCDAIYVRAGVANSPGTPSQPTNLTHAFTLITGNRKYIRVEEGIHVVNVPLELVSDLVIEGGYKVVGGEWKKSSAASSVINFLAFESINNDVEHAIGFKANGVSNWRLQDLVINVAGPSGQTPSGRGRSVYGVWINNCTNYALVRCQVSVGNATNGSNGVAAGAGNGGNGGSGLGAGGGGQGGCGDPGGGQNGASGSAGGSVGALAGGSGGAGGTGCDPCGGAGFCCGECDGLGTCSGAGANGTNGQGWTPGNTPPAPAISGLYFVPAGAAESGAGGGGGGQGGGGGGARNGTCSCINCGGNPNGGAGGNGGRGGHGGTGGKGGGGSFAVFAVNSSSGAQFLDSDFAEGNPGAGGLGGNGETGLPGSPGAAGAVAGCSPCSNSQGQTGAPGGSGGNGGRGRDGAPGVAGALVMDGVISDPSAPIPNPVTLEIQFQNTVGCTNSEITLTKTSGTWTLPTGLSFVNDLDPYSSSYGNSSPTAKIYAFATGPYDVGVNGIDYQRFLWVRTSRPLPVINITPSGSICNLNNLSLSTPTVGDQYEWLIYQSDPNQPIYTSTQQIPGNTGPIPAGLYWVRLRVRTECCGWSIPVFQQIVVDFPSVGGTATASNSQVCPGSQEVVSLTGQSGNILNWELSYNGGPFNSIGNAGNNIIYTGVLNNPGTYEYRAVVKNGTCPAQYSSVAAITVNPQDQATFSYSSNQFCLNGVNPVPTISGTPGGVFSVSNPGLVFVSAASGVINLAASQNGTYDVTYQTNGFCPASSTLQVQLLNPPDATFNAPVSMCSNVPCVTLQPNQPGGVFSGGSYINAGGIFCPASASLGQNPVTYSLTASGCTSTSTQMIQVNPAPNASVASAGPFCSNQADVILQPFTPGGQFSGTCVTQSGIFSPSCGPGQYNITYELTSDSGCTSASSFQLTVIEQPDADITGFGPFCSNDGPQVLTATPSGGQWTVTTYINAAGVFQPQISGPGQFSVTYTVTQGGLCTDSDTKLVTVGLSPNPTIIATWPFCANQPDVQLFTVTPGGTFSGGPYVSSTGFFSPGVSGPGVWPVTYSVTQNGCSASSTVNVIVNNIPDASISGPSVVCLKDPPVQLSAATPGGVWSGGPYIVNGLFNPALAGRGLKPVYYSVTDASGCTGKDTLYIQVDSLPTANFTHQAMFLNVSFQNTSLDATSYIWNFGDGSPASTQVNPIHTYPDNGTYQVTLIAINACGSDTFVKFITVIKAGVEEYPESAFLSVYPNPTSGALYLAHEMGTPAGAIQLKLYNLQGAMIFQKVVVLGAGEQQKISLPELPEGLYLLEAELDNYRYTYRLAIRR
ncbi:MAG: PKD domain-containing protein [Flavobacteriales bacterium]|nr:PKD domain-containing protein [Flavobacteriales bacterium]